MSRFLPSVIVVLTFLTGRSVLASTAFAIGPNLVVNGVVAIHFAQSKGGETADSRAMYAAHRLKRLPYWGAVSVRGEGENRSVVIGTDPLMEVTPLDAALENTTVPLLAKSWAEKLQSALNLPPLRVSDNFVQLPIGKSRTVTVIGSMAGKASATSSDPKIATVTKRSGGFSIKGVGLGQATVSVTCGTDQENVQVTIEPYAAVLPETFDVSVMGSPATEETVKGVAEMAIKTRLQILPDAQVAVSPPPIVPLDAGKSSTYTFDITANSPNGIACKGIATVNVQNVAWPRKDDDFLWYSNNPETVKRYQSLFSANLSRGDSVRLLYHHVNGTNEDIYFRAEIVNDTTIPAQVSITPGDSAPNNDPVNAGFAAGTQFVKSWITGSAEIVTIPPQSALPLSLRRLAPGQTASGLCELRLLSGPPSLLVRTDAMPPVQLDDKWSAALYSSTPWHDVGAHPLNMYDSAPCESNPHVYADPYQNDTIVYKVGGRHGFYRIGQHPLSEVDRGGSLDGNYGVLDRIQATLSNPTPNPTDVELVFEASAGYAGAIFEVNGEPKFIPQLRPNATAQIAKFHLNPGETTTVSLVTVPLSGSSYPATLIIRPILDF
jgi:hypothetical protein